MIVGDGSSTRPVAERSLGKVLTSEINPQSFVRSFNGALGHMKALPSFARHGRVGDPSLHSSCSAFSCYPDFLFLFEDSSWLILFL